jgi:aminomethyltransferase
MLLLVGMGYVKTDYTKPGSEILIQIRDKYLSATVVKFPFINKK